MIKKIIIGVAIIVLGVVAFPFLSAKVGIKPGNMAPNFEAELMDGQSIELKDYQGDYVLLEFWGSWCAPCRRENPSIVKIYQKYQDKKSTKGEGFKILNIALEKIEGQAEAAIKKDNLYWPDHVISMNRIVLASPLARLYGVSSVPSKFLIGPDGKILLANPTIVELEKTLNDKLK